MKASNGVVAADIRLQDLRKEVTSLSLPNDGFMLIYENIDGRLIVSRKDDNFLKAITDVYPEFNQQVINTSLNDDMKFLPIVEIKGKQYFAVSKKLKEVPWTITVAVPTQVIPVHDNISLVIAASVILLLTFIFINLYFKRKVITPLKQVSSALITISDGPADLTQKLPVENEDEIGTLASSFNYFIDSEKQLLLKLRGISNNITEISENVIKESSDAYDSVTQQKIFE